MKNYFGISLVNLKKTPEAEYDIYIGRANAYRSLSASKWANPFIMKNESERARVLEEYRKYILRNKKLYNSLGELKNKKLGCFCSPLRCHGDVIKKWLDKYFGDKEWK